MRSYFLPDPAKIVPLLSLAFGNLTFRSSTNDQDRQSQGSFAQMEEAKRKHKTKKSPKSALSQEVQTPTLDETSSPSPLKTQNPRTKSLPKHANEMAAPTSDEPSSRARSVSQDTLPDCIPPEQRSETYSFALSKDPPEATERQSRPQLQRWVYETRDPVITVVERLEKSRWERCE